MASPRVSVIIPAYQDWPLLKLCLDALADQSFPQDAVEVIVANNDPDDPCPFAGELAANVTILPARPPGSYAARNIAVAAATGDVLAFTDSDCIPERNWLQSGLACLQEAGPDVWVTGPIAMYRPDGGDHVVHLHDARFAFGAYAGIEKRAGATGNMFVRRDVFDRIGAFDATLFSGGDSEWKGRARRHGVVLKVAQGAGVAHPSRRTFEELARKERRRAGGSVKLGRVTLGTALARAKPPVSLMRAADWHGVSAIDRARVFAMSWRLRLIWVAEYLSVRFAGRGAERK